MQQEKQYLKEGVKNDAGKTEWHYLPVEPMEEVVRVLMYGDKKYPAEDGSNWKRVDNPKKRYFNAMIRHSFAWLKGERLDPETGYSHLAHAITNALFLLHFEQEEFKRVEKRKNDEEEYMKKYGKSSP